MCYYFSMKLKYAQLSLWVLCSLIVLSFSFYIYAQGFPVSDKNIFLDSDQDGLSDEEEKLYGTDPKNSDSDHDGYSDGVEVQGGYDPTKPAPGDKIIKKADSSNQGGNPDTQPPGENLTKAVAKRISDIAESQDQEDQEISLDKVQSMVEESLNNTQTSTDDFPDVDPKEIKIKEQNYSQYSPEIIKKKKTEDFVDYIISIYYIFSSNSPRPITSGSDVAGLASSLSSQITSAVITRNPKALEDLSVAGGKILDQMKDLEVPQDLVEIHIKGMRFAKYAMLLQDSLSPKEGDPLTDVANLSKIQGFLENLMSFSENVQSKISEYDWQYNEELKSKLKAKGLFAPEQGDLPALNKDQSGSADY